VRRRPIPSRHDAIAQQFLAAAADLIEAYLQTGPLGHDQSIRLRHVRFPTLLDWLRTDDVIRLTPLRGGEGASRRAFFSRWPTRDAFLPEAVVYALLREYEADDPFEYLRELRHIPESTAPVSVLITNIADGLLSALIRHPRSYLMLHLGPLLPRHPELGAAIRPGAQAATIASIGIYEQLVRGLGLAMRPEWPAGRVSFVLQAMLDGFTLRYRMRPADNPASHWEGTSIFADAIIAFMLGAVDWDLTGQAGRAVLDTLIRPWTPVHPRLPISPRTRSRT
jgi:hypothetical protein